MFGFLTFLYYGTVLTTIITATLFMLSVIHPIFGFVARLIVSYFALLTAAAYGVFVSVILRITVGHGRLAQWNTGRFFGFLMRWGVGVKFQIEDPNNYLGTTRPAVFIGNHQTELDVLMLGCIFPRYCSVTAKKSLKRIPVLGWFMSLSGSIFIDRQNSSSARNAMAGAADDMNRYKQSVYMFPEGTRSYYKDPGLLPFKKGAFHLAVQAQVPVVPVIVANYSNILYLKTWTFRSGTIAVKVLKPIDTKGMTAANVEDFTRDTRDLMLREIASLTSKSRGLPLMMEAEGNGNGVVKASGVEATITS